MDVKPGYKMTEVGVIPDEWESTTVHDIASPVRNAIVGGPFGSDLVSNDYVEDGIPVLRGQNMGTRLVSGHFVFVTRAKASSLEANLARPGDLVFTQRGTLGQVSLVPDQPYERYLVSQSQMKLAVNRRTANPLFFYYVFSSAEQQEFIRQNTIQTGVPHINLGILRAIPVQRPSLAEQEAIAEALSDADALIESLEQLLAKKRQLKQGTMQELLTGKRRLLGCSGQWDQISLGELFTFKNGLNKARQFFGYGTPIVNYMDVFSNSQIYCDRLEGRVSLTPSEVKNFDVKKGDVLFTRTSETPDEIGMASVVLDEPNQTVFSGFVLRGRPKNKRLLDQFKAYCFRSKYVRSQIVAKASYTTRALTNGRILAGVVLPVPDVEEQAAITAILRDMDAEIAALEAKLAKARQLKQGMMQELLTGRIRLV
jgi:type I restriction enzyme S subunit